MDDSQAGIQTGIVETVDAGGSTQFAHAIEQVNGALARLHFSRLRFVLRLDEPMAQLPDLYGSMLRGGLGSRFRQLVCVQPQLDRCRDCPLLQTCAFPAVFETPLPPDIRNVVHYQQVSPYVLRPVSSGGDKAPGSLLEFDLTLFGRAISYLPYFVISYRQLGEKGGLGRERARFTLAQVLDHTPGAMPRVLYSAAGGHVNIQPRQAAVNAGQPDVEDPIVRILIRALTPVRIKLQRQIQFQPSFRAFCAALLRRLAGLSVVHGDGEWDVDAGAILAAADEVQGDYRGLEIGNWQRFSGRQKQRIDMAGAQGNIVYAGALTPFLPLLWAGQYTHVGRGSTFGNGRYDVYVEE